MPKYVLLDSDARATGFYSREVHGANIPPEAILITDQLWQRWIQDTQGLVYSGGDLVPYVAPPAPPPSKQQLIAYASGKTAPLLAAMRSYTDSGVTLKSDATPATISDLMALREWGSANPTATENWVANDNSVTAITGAQILALAPLVGLYRQLVFSELASVITAIEAGTITSFSQVDSATWPV